MSEIKVNQITSIESGSTVSTNDLAVDVASIKQLKQIPNPQLVRGFYDNTTLGGGTFVWDATVSKANHNGGTVIAPEAITVWNGTPAGLTALLSWTGAGLGCYVKLTSSFTVFDFGARTDQDANVVLTHMLNKNIDIDGNNAYFKVNGSLSKTGSVRMKNMTLEFIDGGATFASTVGAWETCTESKVYSGTLPNIEVAGINCSKLTFTGAPTLAVWDVVRVASEEQYPWITTESKVGQMAVVVYVGSDHVLLDRELESDYTYTKVCKYSKDELQLDIKVLNKTDLAVGVGGVLLQLKNYVRANVKVDALESYYQLVNCMGLYDSDITLKGKQIRNYSDDQSKWGYGIVDRACESCRFTIDVRSLRHGYTTTHGGAGTNSEQYGEPRYNTISGRGINCITPFDTHVNGTGIIYQDCTAIGSYGAGFSVRSRNAVLNNCHTIGRTDVGFFIFNNASSTLTVGRGGVVTMSNCSAKDHKRFLRIGHQTENTNTALPAQRMNVVINDCWAELDPYTDMIYAYNARIEADNLRLVNSTTSSSITEATYSESNPIFHRGFVRLTNSEFIGSNITLKKTGNGQKIYPFVLKTDRALYTSADTRVSVDGIELDNSVSKLFTEWGEFVVAQNIAGKKPSDGALDYTSGLDYTFVVLKNVGANTQSRANVMREDVLSYYRSASVSVRAFGWTPTIAKNFNPSWARTLFLDSSAITLDGNVDTWTLTEKPIDVRGDISPVLNVRVTFSNDGGGTGVLQISEIKNLGNLHSTQILRVYSTNAAANRQVSIKDGTATPNDSANKGTTLVAEFWRNGSTWARVI